MTAPDLVPIDLPRKQRRPDAVVDAPDGTADIWAGQAERGHLWDVVVQPNDGEPTEIVWVRPIDGGPTNYQCADCGPTSSRRGCRHVDAATRAAEIYLNRKEPR